MPTEYFEQRERALLGQRYEQLYAAPQQTAERGVTVSALRTTPEQFAQRADFPLEPSPFCKAAFVVHQPDFKPGRHPYHHAGVFYSQEPSASSAAPLLGVQPGMRVLDLCAAPGGKSSQLAAALQGRGVLVSNEYVAARAEILKSNLERMGVSNAVVLNETPARIAEALPEFFDRVLVDAPCSGEGMFRKEPVALQQHCEALVKQCAELGAQILDCAAAALAPGGQLVYSTCTFAPEEDEGQVEAGKKGKGKAKPAKAADARSARRADSRACRDAVQGTSRRTRDTGAGEATPAQSLAAWQEFARQYFPALAQRPAVVHGGGVLLPVAFPQTGLHVLRAGVFVGSVQKGRFVPEHHLFTAFGGLCTNCEQLTLADCRCTEYLSGREVEARTAADGWCCVTVDGWPLGGGKVSGGRVKNHYPKALRLL